MIEITGLLAEIGGTGDEPSHVIIDAAGWIPRIDLSRQHCKQLAPLLYQRVTLTIGPERQTGDGSPADDEARKLRERMAEIHRIANPSDAVVTGWPLARIAALSAPEQDDSQDAGERM